jgi:hypothetical protein
MNEHSESLAPRLLALLQSVRDSHDESARLALNELLRKDAAARAAMARLLVDEQALVSRLRDDRIVSLLEPTTPAPMPAFVGPARWQPWRPLTAAAAGLLLGMFFSSVVLGFVATRVNNVTKVPLAIGNPGMEDASAVLHDGLPKVAGKWGVDSAAVVSTENGVQPAEGSRMLRLQPIPRSKDVKNHSSRAYQVLDLSSLVISEDEETQVQLTASFFSSDLDQAAIYRIRGIALDETPDIAMKDFWSKVENDDVVSVSQKFETLPGEPGWYTFSMKMPLRVGAKTLVILFAATPPEDESSEGSVHYVDDVQVALLTSPAALP